MPHDPQLDDDKLSPSADTSSLNEQPEPGVTDKQISVPQDLAGQGHDTNIPGDDSPESLDEEIAQGANREDIDPHHSIDRPVIDNIDEEEHGVS